MKNLNTSINPKHQAIDENLKTYWMCLENTTKVNTKRYTTMCIGKKVNQTKIEKNKMHYAMDIVFEYAYLNARACFKSFSSYKCNIDKNEAGVASLKAQLKVAKKKEIVEALGYIGLKKSWTKKQMVQWILSLVTIHTYLHPNFK